MLGLDALERAASVARPVEIRARPRATDQREGQHGDHDDGEHDGQDEQVSCSCVTEPVGERVHVAVLDDRLLTIRPSTGAVASSCGMFAVLPATLVATTSRPSTDFSMLVRCGRARQQDGDDERGDEADASAIGQ